MSEIVGKLTNPLTEEQIERMYNGSVVTVDMVVFATSVNGTHTKLSNKENALDEIVAAFYDDPTAPITLDYFLGILEANGLKEDIKKLKG